MKIKKKFNILSNNLSALINYHRRKTVLGNPPSFIWIEPTNNCNLKCIMCPTGTGKIDVKKGFMDYTLYKRIIDETKEYTSAVTLAISGESLLHPEFFKMIEYASSNGVKILLNTNATLLTREKSRLLLDSGISEISFAFDGLKKGTYEKARVGADFEKTLDNILYFLRLKKEKRRKLPYAILSILELELEDYSEMEKADFLRLFDGLIDEIRSREVSTWGSTFKDTDTFSFRDNSNVYGPCSRLWSTACIAWDGDVVPCVYNANHEYVIGNIKNNRLMDIWNNEKMFRLRESMINGDYLNISPLCENCIVLGTPPIFGIPSGIRLSLADAITNVTGYGFERLALSIANRLRNGSFTAKTISE
ncbi:MAG: SPASM domain-containing protein [Candidatus Brocadiales bacterium]|nr:SPASM domain-containing protein [Candidatus Brocadiales bacterium]